MPRTTSHCLSAGLVGAALSGCIALPLPPISYNSFRSIPSVVPHLHDDLRTSTDEVLVLIESEAIPDKGKGWSRYLESAHFCRASELGKLSADVPRENVDHGWGWAVMFGGDASRKPARLGNWPESHTYVRVVCIVVPDGRTIRLKLDHKGDDYSRINANLAVETRDRVVNTLRLAQSGEPIWFLGPCDLEGTADWPDALRARVANYLSNIAAD